MMIIFDQTASSDVENAATYIVRKYSRPLILITVSTAVLMSVFGGIRYFNIQILLVRRNAMSVDRVAMINFIIVFAVLGAIVLAAIIDMYTGDNV